MTFSIVSNGGILDGKTTDIFFLRTERVLKRKGVNWEVVAEVTTTGNGWSVLTGLADMAQLLGGKDVNARRHDRKHSYWVSSVMNRG